MKGQERRRAGRLRTLLVLAATGASAGTATVWMSPVRAVEPPETGWWWQGTSTPSGVGLRPVPEVDEGGLYVAGDLTGPTGVSAVRFELLSGERPTTLTLTVDEAIGVPAVIACPPSYYWSGAENGPWGEQPACGGPQVPGALSADGTTITFELRGLRTDEGLLDLVLLPSPSVNGAAPAFSASFAPPGGDALEVEEDFGALDDDDDITTGDDSGSGSDFDDTAAGDFGGGSTSFDDGGSFDPSAGPTLSGPAPGDSIAGVSPPPSAPSRLQPAASAEDDAASDQFAYPAVLALPLLFLAFGGYLGRVLTRPMVANASARHA